MALDDLMSLVERHGFTVEWEPIAGDFLGAVDLRRGIIYLERNLDSRPRHAVSVLAHELGHIALGHGCTQNVWGERRADEWAAELLISPEEYALAEATVGPYPSVLAVELGVTMDIITAYQRMLTSIAA